MNEEIQNARIKSTMFGFEDHGIMTCMLHLEYGGGTAQGFGGAGFDVFDPENPKHRKKAFAKFRGFGTAYLAKILETVGEDKWEKLPGKYVRVKFGDKPAGWGSDIVAIGNIMEDKWFYPAELVKKFELDKYYEDISND